MNNNKTSKERSRAARGKQAALRAWGIYLLALVAWAAGVLVLLYLGLMVGTNITWQPGLLYSVLSLIKEFMLLVIIIMVLA